MHVSIQALALGTVVWAFMVTGLRRERRWLSFYLLGGLGFVLIVVLWASHFGLDEALESFEARLAVEFATAAGIALARLGATGLAIPNHTGWAVFDVGIECSALIEMAAIVGLSGFYPAFGASRKLRTASIGAVVTFGINMARIMLIVALINAFGTAWVFAAHAVFGRMFFFLGTVALYWWLVTRPTVGTVGVTLEERADE